MLGALDLLFALGRDDLPQQISCRIKLVDLVSSYLELSLLLRRIYRQGFNVKSPTPLGGTSQHFIKFLEARVATPAPLYFGISDFSKKHRLTSKLRFLLSASSNF